MNEPTVAYQSQRPPCVNAGCITSGCQNRNIFLMDFQSSLFICLPKCNAPKYFPEISSSFHLKVFLPSTLIIFPIDLPSHKQVKPRSV